MIIAFGENGRPPPIRSQAFGDTWWPKAIPKLDNVLKWVSICQFSYRPRTHLRWVALQPCFLFDFLAARAPLILQAPVEAALVDRLGPPFTPAREKDLLWVRGEVGGFEGSKKAPGAYSGFSRLR